MVFLSSQPRTHSLLTPYLLLTNLNTLPYVASPLSPDQSAKVRIQIPRPSKPSCAKRNPRGARVCVPALIAAFRAKQRAGLSDRESDQNLSAVTEGGRRRSLPAPSDLSRGLSKPLQPAQTGQSQKQPRRGLRTTRDSGPFRTTVVPSGIYYRLVVVIPARSRR